MLRLLVVWSTYLVLVTLAVQLVLPLAAVLDPVTEPGPAHTPTFTTEELSGGTGGSAGNLQSHS